MTSKKPMFPAQHQNQQPGIESDMHPLPESIRPTYQGSGKLKGKVALVTGGDSGIGRSVAIHFAREGADVTVVYFNEHEDAKTTKEAVEKEGKRCLLMAGDVGLESFCQVVIAKTVETFGHLDVLVNNAAEQHLQKSLVDISSAQLEKTFRTNIFSFFHITKAALPHLKKGSSIINTTSITAYQGNQQLIDYSATKGAILAMTRSLSQQLISQGIRVNAVAPGPIWTPLIPSTFTADQVAVFGSDTPMQRAGQPSEVGPCYVFLASEDAAYMAGQVLHPNGGVVVNG